MKKLIQIIKEELITEKVKRKPIGDENDTVIKVSDQHPEYFNIVQKSDDGNMNSIVFNMADIPKLINVLKRIK